MKQLYRLAVPFLGIIAGSALAAPNFTDTGYLYIDYSAKVEPDLFGADLGILGYVNDYVSLQGSLSFFASEPLEDYFTGINIAAHLNAPWTLSPYIGIGLFSGYSEERVLADRDGKDNDGDNFIDERGEKRTRIDAVTFNIYPEVGLSFWLSKQKRVHIAARYLVSSAGRDFDSWIYSLGFSFTY